MSREPLGLTLRDLAFALLATAALAGLAGCSVQPNAALPTAFVSLPGADAVEKVDLRTGRILAHTVVGKLPHNLLLGPDGTRIYASLVGSQAIAEIDAATGEVLRTFLSEPVPHVRVDGTVIQEHIDENAFTKTTCYACHNTIIGSRPFGMALSEDGERLYVTNIGSGNVSTIALDSGDIESIVHLPPEGEAHEATGIARLGHELFVSITPTQPSSEPAVIRRLAADNGLEVLSHTHTGPDAPVLLADPVRQQIYASNRETNTVSRFDAQGQFIGTFTVGNSPIGLTFSQDQEQLLVANFYDGTVSVLDPATGKASLVELVLDGMTFANPTHLALANGGRSAYVVSASPKQGNLVEIDLNSLVVVRALPIGGLGYDIVTLPPPPPTP